MKLHNISQSSSNFHYRKCSICKLTVKPGETIVTEGPRLAVHRSCLATWLDATYAEQPLDNNARRDTKQEREAKRVLNNERKFNEYREELLARYGMEDHASETGP